MRHSFTCCSLIQARSCRNQSRHARTPGEAASPATDWASNGTVSFSLPRRVGREDRRQKTGDNAQVDPRWFSMYASYGAVRLLDAPLSPLLPLATIEAALKKARKY